MSEQVLVIGGGIAGLTAAAHMAARGVPVTLLDSDALWTGGRLAGGAPDTLRHNGQTWHFRSEHGVHAVWGGYRNFRATLARFTHTRLIPSYGEEWINRWGREVRRLEAGNAVRARFVPAPFHYLNLLLHPRIWSAISPWDFLSLPALLVSISLTVGVDPLKEGKAWDGLGMEEFFRGWTPNLKATFKGLGVNLLAAPPEAINLASFVAVLRFYTMLRRDAWDMAYFPEDGETSVIAPLVRAITAHGGHVWRGMTATRLARTPDGWRVSAEDGAQGITRSLAAEQVVLAVQPPAAQQLLLASPDTAAWAQTLRFPRALNTTTVRLWFAAAPQDGTQGGMLTGDFVPNNFFWLHRLYSDFRAWHEATGGSALELHFYPPAATVHLPDSYFLVQATSEAVRAFPELKHSFLHGVVRRNSQTQTAFRVPTADSLHVRTPLEGLWTCGDWVGYDTPSFWLERAATTAIAAANGVLAARGLAPYDVLQPPAPELPARALAALIGVGRRIFSRFVAR